MSEIIASGVVVKKSVQEFLDVLKSISDESRVHWNEDGLVCRCVDPANVAMNQPVELHANGFESYESPGSATIGISHERFGDYINAADSGDLIKLRVDMETRKLLIDYRNIHHKMALIDPDSIRQEPDDPGLELPNSVTISGQDMQDVVDATDLTSDHVTVVGDPGAEEVRFVAEGDLDDTVVDFGNDDVVDARVSEDAKSMFSLEYLTDLAKPVPKDSEVTIEFGGEFPAYVEWSAHEGMLDVRQMLAPRVNSD